VLTSLRPFTHLVICIFWQYVYCTLTEVFLTRTDAFLILTEVFPCFSLSCKANAKVNLAKTGHRQHSSTLLVICVVRLLFVLFYVLFVCKCVLPPGDNPIAVNNHIISYHISYHIIDISYHIISYISYHKYIIYRISYHISYITLHHITSHHISYYIYIIYHILYHISYHILYHISYIIPYHIISHYIISYHIISYHIISYHMNPSWLGQQCNTKTIYS
jgi:hypothetical protein